MREIKFGYIFQNQETARFLEIRFDYADVYMGKAKLKVDEIEKSNWFCIAKRQYTGLRDKNGTEIYEGDILESTIVGKKFRGEVFWETCSYRVKQDDLDITLGHDKESKRRVVGNIYEHSHLKEANHE